MNLRIFIVPMTIFHPTSDRGANFMFSLNKFYDDNTQHYIIMVINAMDRQRKVGVARLDEQITIFQDLSVNSSSSLVGITSLTSLCRTSLL